MLKEIGISAVILASTAIGFRMSLDLSGRAESLRQLERMAMMLKGEIRYAGTPLQEAIFGISKRMAAPFDSFFEEVARDMGKRDGRTLAVIFRECAGRLPKECGLTEDDVESLAAMGGRLGYLDRKMQLQTIELYAKELEGERARAEGEYRQKAKVYRCLGFLGGLFFAVLLF
ncbi:MAG: stage III sporulation protein AB [Eubacteriales bacterium]|nr:stage III sporulation protein AB [Eubacteriales bacterium]